MRPPETAVEVWLARDGWNQIDPRRARERARNRLASVGLLGLLFLPALFITSEWRSPQNLLGILGAVLFVVLCVGLLLQVVMTRVAMDDLAGPLTPGGRALLTMVLKQVVGPNNTFKMEPGQDLPPDTQMVQRSISTAMSAEELALLEPLFDQLNQKSALMARSEREPPLIELALSGAGRAAFSLAADLRGQDAKKEAAQSNLIRLTGIIAGLPTELDKDDPVSLAAMRSAMSAWFEFKDLWKA